MSRMSPEELQRAVASIDALNARDPNSISVSGEERPKELVHAELVTQWVERLEANASDALRLAARAHHVERWTIPRSEYPQGREGYLKWRAALQTHHAETAARVLGEQGLDPDTISRVQDIIHKRRLRSDPEVQCFEDALCLVFLETQLSALADRLDDDKMIEVLRRTLPKMSSAGREAALSLDLGSGDRELLERAIAARQK